MNSNQEEEQTEQINPIELSFRPFSLRLLLIHALVVVVAAQVRAAVGVLIAVGVLLLAVIVAAL